MIVLLGIILVSRVECRTIIKDLPQTQIHKPLSRNFIINSMDKSSENYDDTYIGLKGKSAESNELDILSEEERIFSNKWNSEHRLISDKSRELIETYVLVNTVRERNKRYVGYLTLCHFKICNMGKKRTPRYTHRMRKAGARGI